MNLLFLTGDKTNHENTKEGKHEINSYRNKE